MSLTSTLGVVAEDNYSTSDKISIDLVTPIPTGFDDDSNFLPDAAGSYVLQYNATDENGNTTPTPLDFTINVKDVSRPTITYTGSEFKDGNPYMIVEAGADTDLEDETLMQLKATDSKGVDMTTPDIYLFNSRGYSQNVVGSYVVTYKVDDVYGKTSLPFDYSIDVKDTIAPTITGATGLADPLAMGTSLSLTDTSILGITIADSFDTTPNLIIHDDGGFDKNKPGTYIVSYDASDDSGNLYSDDHGGTYYTYSIQVTDQTAPLLLGSIAGTISAGTTIDQSYIDDYASRGITVVDNYDTAPTVIANYVDETGATITPDTSKAVDIIVNYDAVDSAGNKYSDPLPIGYGTLYQYIIHVVDDVAPTISGPTEKTIDFGLLSKSFDPLSANSLGLTITDNVDKNPQLIFDPDGSDTYNGEKVGVYNMKYVAVDNDNNISDPWSYTITVSAQPPTITTSGDQLVTIDPSVTDDWINRPKNVGISAAGEDANFDGIPDDLTSLITVKENGGFDSTIAGTYPVKYEVIDPVSGLSATETVNVIVQAPAGASFYGMKSAQIGYTAKFDYKSSTATKLYVFTDKPMTLEEAIADGIVTIKNYGSDNDETTTLDNFKGDGSDAPDTYLVEYVATFNGITTSQKYPIEVKVENPPRIIGRSSTNYFSSDPITYKDPQSMGMFGLSSIFSDITSKIEYTSTVDASGSAVTLNTAGGNAAGVYTLQYDLHDPISGLDAVPYMYTITISNVKNPVITYKHPNVASDGKGMISYDYSAGTTISTETWQSGYNANLLDPSIRFTAKSGDGARDIPISLSSDGGYTVNYKTPNKYNVRYTATDELTNTSTEFKITLVVKDTLPPQFFGTDSYTITQGAMIDTGDVSLFTVDNSDGLKQSWSETVSADHMTVTNAVNAVDPSIPFKGDGNDDVGDYLIEVTAKDAYNNISKKTVYISVMSLFTPPLYQGTGTQVFHLGSNSYHMFYFNKYSGGNVDPNLVKFKDYLNKQIPLLEGVQDLNPASHTTYGVFYAGGDHTNKGSDGNYYSQLTKGMVQNETYCATDNAGQTTCQAVVINAVT